MSRYTTPVDDIRHTAAATSEDSSEDSSLLHSAKEVKAAFTHFGIVRPHMPALHVPDFKKIRTIHNASNAIAFSPAETLSRLSAKAQFAPLTIDLVLVRRGHTRSGL